LSKSKQELTIGSGTWDWSLHGLIVNNLELRWKILGNLVIVGISFLSYYWLLWASECWLVEAEYWFGEETNNNPLALIGY
jgi:hypothetical protein